MAKRRPSDDGMVRKRDDGRWEGRIVVGHKEKEECEKPLAMMIAEMRAKVATEKTRLSVENRAS